jgi:hypothetical protein
MKGHSSMMASCDFKIIELKMCFNWCGRPSLTDVEKWPYREGTPMKKTESV